MSDSSQRGFDAASRFFDNYLVCLDKRSVPDNHRRWYVKRVEEFINAQRGHKIKALSGAEVSGYLETLGRQNRLSGWQFSQCIDAIRILSARNSGVRGCRLGLLARFRQAA